DDGTVELNARLPMFARSVRQVWDELVRRSGRYRDTVRSETVNPSFMMKCSEDRVTTIGQRVIRRFSQEGAFTMPWDLRGNAIADGDFLGTTNAKPLVVKTSKGEALRVDTNGNLGIGTGASIPNKLTVTGSLAASLVGVSNTQGIALEASALFDNAVV